MSVEHAGRCSHLLRQPQLGYHPAYHCGFYSKARLRLRRLPSLLVANVGVAHRGADILVVKQLLDFPQIRSPASGVALYTISTTSAKAFNRQRKVPSGNKIDHLDAWSLADALRVRARS